MNDDEYTRSLLAGTELEDCGDPTCFGIHDLGQLPNERREDWLARLRDRFVGEPLPIVHAETMAKAANPAPPATHICAVCESLRDENGVCQSCAAAWRGRSGHKGTQTAKDGTLICRRCGAPREPNQRCLACLSKTMARKLERWAV